MANTVTITDQDIIEVAVVGNQTSELVAMMGEDVKRCLATLAKRGKPGLILDDITRLGQTDIPARQMVDKLAKSLPYERVAMVGNGSTLMRVGTNLLLKAIGMGAKIKYFEDRDEALQWLTHRR